MNNNFWTDELVKEFAQRWHGDKSFDEVVNELMPRAIEKFKESKTKPEHKDYEILSYRNPNSFTDIPNADIINAKGSEANIAVLRNYPIHSVLRKSDGDIISIGDIDGFANSKVMRIYIENGKMCILTETGWNYLDKFKKVKQPIPLFTEDGVRVFNFCSKAFVVFIKDGYGFEPFNFIPQRWTVDTTANYFGNVKYFSTEEAAKEFCLLNKPCLSLKDIEDNILEYHGENYKGLFKIEIENLKQLAKSKL